MEQYGFYFDSERCTGCKTCELACKDYKDLGTDVNFRRIYEYTGGNWNQQADGCWHQDVFAYYMSISCNHCAAPACTKVCPTGAMHKNEDGFVIVNEETLSVAVIVIWHALTMHRNSMRKKAIIRSKTDLCGCLPITRIRFCAN